VALRIKTIEYNLETFTALRTTVLNLAGTNFATFNAQTFVIPETTNRTFRSVEMIFTFRDAETTTAWSVDCMRMGIQIDAVAFSDLDLTGTGITNTGDPYVCTFVRDVTSYFQTNFTGSSHSVVARIEVENSAISTIDNITCKFRITYEYNDVGPSEYVKTVRIPIESHHGYLSVTPNTNIRNFAAQGQVPALDNFLPESGKTYRQIWFEIMAATADGATGDFSGVFAIGSGARTGAGIEQGLNGSTWYYDQWIYSGFVTNSGHDFQGWSTLASRFERCGALMGVTYTYSPSSTGVMNSVFIPMNTWGRSIEGTTAADQDVFYNNLYVQEPGTISLKQSAIVFFWNNGAAGNLTFSVSGSKAATGSQGVVLGSYTGTAFNQAGHHSIIHRLDLAHGGTALGLNRGLNVLNTKVFASVNGVVTGPNGYYVINYTSDVHPSGEGCHNHTTFWSLFPSQTGAIAGDTFREIATTISKVPIIPETGYFLNSVGLCKFMNHSANGSDELGSEILANEYYGDGWAPADVCSINTDTEYGVSWIFSRTTDSFNAWAYGPTGLLDIEVARKYRIDSTIIAQRSISRIINYHAINYWVSGNIVGYSGNGNNIPVYLYRTDNEYVGSGLTVSGYFQIPHYDNTIPVFVTTQSGAAAGRSVTGLAQ
jgi:hypothetical protein